MAKIRILELPQQISWDNQVHVTFPEVTESMKKCFYTDDPDRYHALILKQDVLIVIAKK